MGVDSAESAHVGMGAGLRLLSATHACMAWPLSFSLVCDVVPPCRWPSAMQHVINHSIYQ